MLFAGQPVKWRGLFLRKEDIYRIWSKNINTLQKGTNQMTFKPCQTENLFPSKPAKHLVSTLQTLAKGFLVEGPGAQLLRLRLRFNPWAAKGDARAFLLGFGKGFFMIWMGRMGWADAWHCFWQMAKPWVLRGNLVSGKLKGAPGWITTWWQVSWRNGPLLRAMSRHEWGKRADWCWGKRLSRVEVLVIFFGFDVA